jgi:23S rRNA pseudouridine1911/1915/1917 synthase
LEPISRKVVIPERFAGRRLDQTAAALLPEFSRTRLQQWLQSGELTLEGAAAEAKHRVRGGEALELAARLEPVVPVAPEPIPLTIVFEDPSLVVVAKPAGLVVHPGAGNRAGTLQNALLAFDPTLAQLPRAGLVHRLDKDTSGLLLIARTLQAHARLAAALERREIRRAYQAVCAGVATGGGTIDAPIGRHGQDRTRMAVRDGGREARTHYRVLERFRAHTHFEVALETGRTHQIRVHFAHIRMPLVGDPEYGGRPRLPRQPSEVLKSALAAFRRQALHAMRLELAHPQSGEPLRFEYPPPADFEALLAALREDAAGAASADRPGRRQ